MYVYLCNLHHMCSAYICNTGRQYTRIQRARGKSRDYKSQEYIRVIRIIQNKCNYVTITYFPPYSINLQKMVCVLTSLSVSSHSSQQA